MHTRLKVAAIIVALSGIAVGIWREFADQRSAIEQADCTIADPLSSCAVGPKLGIAADDLVTAQPALASARLDDGTLATIRFAPQAQAADITEFLDVNSITLVDGPKSGGMYTVRLPEIGKAKRELIKRLQIETAIVDFIATVQ
jgi:hypothetical protein